MTAYVFFAMEAHKAIECLAYELWPQRGCLIGSPEIDWLGTEKPSVESRTDSEASLSIAVLRMGPNEGPLALIREHANDDQTCG